MHDRTHRRTDAWYHHLGTATPPQYAVAVFAAVRRHQNFGPIARRHHPKFAPPRTVHSAQHTELNLSCNDFTSSQDRQLTSSRRTKIFGEWSIRLSVYFYRSFICDVTLCWPCHHGVAAQTLRHRLMSWGQGGYELPLIQLNLHKIAGMQ